MGKLQEFTSLKEKQRSFCNHEIFQIDTKNQFDDWFDQIVSQKAENRTNFIFRGMKEAKHKLYTSSQRQWIQNDMKDWRGADYFSFINSLVQKAKNYHLIKKVFDTYGYSLIQREFPILSILQHYGAPTPLMDWTYNVNVALFFGTEGLLSGYGGRGNINNYFSIYCIDKALYKNEFLNIRDFTLKQSKSFMDFKDWKEDSRSPNKNNIFYISDFDNGNSGIVPTTARITIVNDKHLTSIYNQNIIPQEGLFIFNPFSDKSIDQVFNIEKHSEGSNLVLGPFDCINIRKDLSDYIRRRIKYNSKIENSFIYPHLYNDAKVILNDTLNSFV
jgi:hypothetical protein